MNFLLITIVLFAIELLYFKIADRYNIIDKPNHRSSHTNNTISGGGVVFPIAALIACLLGYSEWVLTLAVILVAIVSFIDDIKPISKLPRFGVLVFAFVLVAYDLHLFQEALWILPLTLILFIGWISAFNFMDGINGITVLYALTALVSFAVLPIHESSLSLLITIGLSCLVFGFFNVRKSAKTFAGDVGSISLALFLGYFMIKTIFDSGQIGYLLFFSVYGIDAIITIFTRIKKRENIFEAHRSHLYQYLVNEHGYSHILIAIIYALLQLLVNVMVLYLDRFYELSIYISVVILLVLTVVYLVVRARVLRSILFKKE